MMVNDYSRYIITWRLTTTMTAADVTDTLEDALKATGLWEAQVRRKPGLLSDNGPCYISGELRTWLKDQDIEHTRGASYHPQTQGKIERYHRSIVQVPVFGVDPHFPVHECHKPGRIGGMPWLLPEGIIISRYGRIDHHRFERIAYVMVHSDRLLFL